MSNKRSANLAGLSELTLDEVSIKKTRLLQPDNTARNDLLLPTVNGTLALNPSAGSYVDTASDQTVGGNKTYSGTNIWNGIATFNNDTAWNGITFISQSGSLRISSPSAYARFVYAGALNSVLTLPPNATGTLALTSGSQTISDKTFDASTTTFQNGTDFLKIVPDATNANGTNQLNVLFNTTTPNLTHTLRFGNGTAPAVNTTWSLDPNGGTLVNNTNSQTISGSWNFASGSGTSDSTVWRRQPTGTLGLVNPNNYYWSVFKIPATSGGTGGSLATLRVEGAPNNGSNNESNTDAIRCEAGSIRTVTGNIIAGGGTLSVPAFRMIDTGSGLYRPAPDQVATVCNGGVIMTCKATTPHVAITGDTTTTGSLRIGSLGSASANIRSGTFTFSSSSLTPDTGQFSLAPSFGVTFSAPPRVWVSLDIKNFSNGIVLHPLIQSVSTTGFTFTVWNTSNSLTYVGGVIDAYWLAIG